MKRRKRKPYGPEEDLVGRRFGRLLVVEQCEGRLRGMYTWRCKCDCGTTRIVPTSALNTGNTTSCGCLTKENQRKAVALPVGEAAFRRVVHSYKDAARKKGRVFELSRNDMRHLTKQNCYYCGAEPFTVKTEAHLNGSYVYNGVDRIDTAGGYTPDNVVACCRHCNMAKRAMTQGEFVEWARKLYNHWARDYSE